MYKADVSRLVLAEFDCPLVLMFAQKTLEQHCFQGEQVDSSGRILLCT